MNNLEYKTLDNLIENELKMQTQRFEQKQQEIINNSLKEKDKEIERLNKELKLKTDFIEELLTIISVARDYELHDKCYTRSRIYQDKLKSLKEGK